MATDSSLAVFSAAAANPSPPGAPEGVLTADGVSGGPAG